MAFGAPSIKGRALRYLGQRDHSRLELERKLARHVEDRPDASAKAQIAAALDELSAHGLLDEARAAESVVRSHSARFGDRRLRQTLKSKGIDAELITSTLQSAAASATMGTEIERARALWQRRFGTLAADARERAKHARFLIGRGFGGDAVRRVVQGIEDD
ncbi:MAG: regulatory protein RecX [Rubrivivax sp.]